MAASVLDRPVLHDLDDFLAWLQTQEGRYEFIEGRIVAMAGGSYPHAVIQGNLIAAIHGQLRGGPCRVLGGDLLVPTHENNRRGRFPDAAVTCSRETEHRLRRPVILFEILSPGSERDDRGDKWLEYRSLPSLMHYVLIAQDQVRVEHFRREGEAWRYVALDDVEGVLALDPPGITLRLGELYEGVDFAAAEGLDET